MRPRCMSRKSGSCHHLRFCRGGIKITLRNASDAPAVHKILRKIEPDMDSATTGPPCGAHTEVGLKKIKDTTIDQSIEIVRRRVDESGTKEPISSGRDDRIILELPGSIIRSDQDAGPHRQADLQPGRSGACGGDGFAGAGKKEQTLPIHGKHY